jgi:hypothetical protein
MVAVIVMALAYQAGNPTSSTASGSRSPPPSNHGHNREGGEDRHRILDQGGVALAS